MSKIDKNNLPNIGGTQGILNSQREAQQKVVENPFGNFNVTKVSLQPTQERPQAVRQSVPSRPTQKEFSPVSSFQSENTVKRTSSGRVVKRTKRGDPYLYEDKYNHNGDVKFKRIEEVHYDLRMPKDLKEKLMAKARANNMSFNQMVLRSIDYFTSNVLR